VAFAAKPRKGASPFLFGGSGNPALAGRSVLPEATPGRKRRRRVVRSHTPPEAFAVLLFLYYSTARSPAMFTRSEQFWFITESRGRGSEGRNGHLRNPPHCGGHFPLWASSMEVEESVARPELVSPSFPPFSCCWLNAPNAGGLGAAPPMKARGEQTSALRVSQSRADFLAIP
jgi:hypothetical protein